ncbi:terminase small subunit [Salsuginibacillus halophilus]|uniref:Terminase small subunit n=1 Tax=Salsuginibacillus halophilus TaxID=517424 RepID=A0A2P8H650_9BACI|nr:terminase small subunit [Salsuginibacillus halophilus]PSL41715.1 terminase small subunit [Salsuginibacillus halophilus]
MSDLTAKQEKFVQGLVSGLSQREAYKQAGYSTNMSAERMDTAANKVLKNAKVSTRYEELMQEHRQKALWTREEAVNDLIWLKDQSKYSIEAAGVRQANSNAMLNAIKELNAIEGLYEREEEGGERVLIVQDKEAMRKAMQDEDS